ncbi:hypothetical protein RA290_05600 [Pantoea agglomerans]|uniref:hypothetical protein n=1 Tax=Enterobacter agglomerans TaxID=549 RepID=UPI003AAD37BE
MMDCILFKDDGTTKLMKVKDGQLNVNIPNPGSDTYTGYPIKHFDNQSGNDRIVYLIASLDPVSEGEILDAINSLRPQPIELIQKS